MRLIENCCQLQRGGHPTTAPPLWQIVRYRRTADLNTDEVLEEYTPVRGMRGADLHTFTDRPRNLETTLYYREDPNRAEASKQAHCRRAPRSHQCRCSTWVEK